MFQDEGGEHTIGTPSKRSRQSQGVETDSDGTLIMSVDEGILITLRRNN